MAQPPFRAMSVCTELGLKTSSKLDLEILAKPVSSSHSVCV